MIEVVHKVRQQPDGAGKAGWAIAARINGKPRVRNFLVSAYGGVKEDRQVGRKPHVYCKVRDDFLAGELSAIANCDAIASETSH